MSEQLFLSSGSLEGLRESGSFGRPLHTLFAQLRIVLESELGYEDSLLLAEPVVDEQRNLIDWYSQGSGKPVALARLPESERLAVHQRLVAAYERMTALAERYANSGDADKLQLGAVLKAALVPPADANVFLVDGRPVVTFWGFFQDRDWGGPMDLAQWRNRYRQSEAVEPVSVSADPSSVDTESTGPSKPLPPAALPELVAPVQERPPPSRYFVVVGSRFFWGVALASIVLLTLLVFLHWLGLLPFERTRYLSSELGETGRAGAGDTLTRLRQEEDALRAKLDELSQLAERKRMLCSADASKPAAPPAPPAGEAASQPQGPVTPTAEENRQFDQRLAGAGAATGEITVSLLWNNKNDLDLVVICPSGKLLYYNNPSECGGKLDVDKNVSNFTDHPVENIYWPSGQAPAGSYQVAVKYYARRDSSVAPETSFQVRLLKDAETLLFKGSAMPDETKPVTEFSVER